MDFLQFITAMTGSIILAIVVLNTNEIGGIDGLKAQLPEGALSFFPSFETDSSMSSAGMLSLSLGSLLALIALP